jgi:DNA (cytosine-5)-methyltransferase 1
LTPRALDLFCGAGGATRGLQLAGFHVTGVDIRPQKRYCGDVFHRADALTFPLDGYDFIWASPPCQRYTDGAKKWGTSLNHPDLIAPIRQRLTASRTAYVIENVESARDWLIDPVLLCGTQFDLGVFRHRLFECWPRTVPAPAHLPHTGRIGDGKYVTVTGHAGGSSKRDGWKNGGVAEGRVAMGIDWMTWRELAEAIPPAYSELLGRLMAEAAALL